LLQLLLVAFLGSSRIKMRYTVRAGVSLGYLAATAAAAATLKCRDCTKTVTRDVVVVGGGASGAHAAVWLRDNGNSVVVVEKADQLVSASLFSGYVFPFLCLPALPGWPHGLLP
jgi:heterodisulfide reductase subunit A-like polyferredoxin